MKRKYPASMFIMGVIIELFRLRLQLLVAVILLIASFFIEQLPVLTSFLIFAVCVVVAIVKQMRQRKAILTMNPNHNANDLLDKMFADNDNGYRNVIDAVNEVIEQHNSDSDSDADS